MCKVRLVTWKGPVGYRDVSRSRYVLLVVCLVGKRCVVQAINPRKAPHDPPHIETPWKALLVARCSHPPREIRVLGSPIHVLGQVGEVVYSAYAAFVPCFPCQRTSSLDHPLRSPRAQLGLGI